MTGIASLGFMNGPSVKFRIDPQSIDWNFTIITSVTETLGGRVVQVIGSTLSDMTVSGQFGEIKGANHAPSWAIARDFYNQIQAMMDYQSKGATTFGKMGQPAVFSYAPLGIRLGVFIKAMSDPDGGGSLSESIGKFSHQYTLTFFIQQSGTSTLRLAGTDSNGVIDAARKKSVYDYMGRISNGIGWKYSSFYNGAYGDVGTGMGTAGATAVTDPSLSPTRNKGLGG